MDELAQTQVGDGDEVDGGSEAASGALGLLEQAVHGRDEGVGAMVEPAAHDAVDVLLERGGQALEGVEPAAPGPRGRARARQPGAAPRQPERLAALHQAWADWNALMPPIPEDAAVSLGYSAKDLPQR